MLETFLGTLTPLLMMFSCILAGFVLNKLKIMPQDTSTVLARCEKYLFVPAMSYSTFSKYCTIDTIGENINIIGYSVIAISFAMMIATPLSKAFEKNDLYKRNIYKYSLVFANHGFMGNAIVPLVLMGQEHLYKYLLFTLSLQFMTYVWGIRILTPVHKDTGGIKNLCSAPFAGIAMGVIVGITGIQKYMPAFVVKTVDSLKSCMGPVAMVLTGFVIGGFSVKSIIGEKKVYIATFLRLIILPAVILGLLMLCGASKYILTLALFAYATPLGLNTIIFPSANGEDTKTGAGMALISDVLCVLTIPIMYSLLSLI